MESLSLPVIHPGFERLKHSGTWLHITAGLLILTHAISHVRHQESPNLYFWCLLLIALDIFILVLAARDLLIQSPGINLFFRVVEIIFFLGIGMLALAEGNIATGCIHLVLSFAYGFLYYCERKLKGYPSLSFHHSGVSIPGVPQSRWLLWIHINKVEASYDSIRIHIAGGKDLYFDLRQNLEFAELEQIHEFCRHYLGA